MSRARTTIPEPADGIHCRRCRRPIQVTDKRKRSWCSVTCHEAAWLDMSTAAQRNTIFKRDKGICAMCGENTRITSAFNQWRVRTWSDATFDFFGRRFAENLHRALDRARRLEETHGGWDMDHIHEVVWGGGGSFDPSNLQTLCKPCHKDKTAKLAAYRAALRALGTGLLRVYRLPNPREEKAMLKNFFAGWGQGFHAVRKPLLYLGWGLQHAGNAELTKRAMGAKKETA